MSSKIFKEILKPCSNLPSSSCTSTSTSTQASSTADIPNPNPTTRRIPPKTSISQQLLRLENLFPPSIESNRPIQPPPPPPPLNADNAGVAGKKPVLLVTRSRDDKRVADDDDDDGEDGEGEKGGVEKKPKFDVFSFGETGPYVPLVLSSPGELPLIQVPASINCRLLEHQREGVKFLYQMYKNNHGGILGDDMGLGKTIQTIAFLAAIFVKDSESSDRAAVNKTPVGKKAPVLIICPASVQQNWENEFSNWSTFRVSIYHGLNRDLILDKVEAQGLEVMITSFDSFRIYGDTICEVPWEVVIVDEAHRLKNEKSKLYIACLNIQTKKRYGLTGTVMQNKIMELFNLFDWVAPGSLGTREHFRDFYDEPLKLGQRSNAPEKFVQIADERKQHLAVVLGKYLLRRTKEETIGNLMLGKEDNVVFCEMSELQKRAYRRMLQLQEIQCLINKDLPCLCGSPLTQVECHKRTVEDGIIWKYLHRDSPDGCNLCPFCVVLPCILKLQQISNHLELIKPNPKDDPEKQKKDADLVKEVFGSDIDSVGGHAQNEDFMDLSDVRHCGKMKALNRLLSSWISQGDKVLLFSYSVRMLDILEKYLIRKGYCFSRLDGSTPTGSRQSLVNDFNSSPSKQVFLVSTRAGGLGLNLVSANRVVIFDPNWNPSHDLQAQDRSFRLGQKRHVVVFRLIAAGSLEELVYTRQVYKQQLSNIAVSGKMEKRYFEGVQDHKQFQGELFGISNLFRDLADKLFTSEIIEHENQSHKYVSRGSKQQQKNDPGVHFAPSTAITVSSLSDSGVRKPVDSEKTKTNKPLLEELGIIYSHRYEDIVNIKAGSEVSKAYIISAPNSDVKGSSSQISVEKSRKSLSEEDKKRHFSRIAKFAGKSEIEFSKWVLSAVPFELENILCDYKKRGKKNVSIV